MKRPHAIVVCLVGAWLGAHVRARADLVIDLRAKSTTAGSVVDDKHVLFSGRPGDTVTCDIWAVVTDGNGNARDDSMLKFHGSLLTSAGGLLGDLAARRNPEYIHDPGGDGYRSDLDGDGDLDVGSNLDEAFLPFFRVYHGQFVPYDIPALLVGTVTWTCTGGGGETLLRFRIQNHSIGARWFQDGVETWPDGTNYYPLDPVRITDTPEPAGAVPLLVIWTTFATRHRRARQRK